MYRSRLVALVISSGISLVVAEAGTRLLFRDRLGDPQNEQSLLYRHDDTLGWFPEPCEERLFRGSRLIHVEHNSDGFRDSSHALSERPRLAFLGDSFVWGYDVERHERFTEILQDKYPQWEIINLGVSGYGTDQEYLLVQRVFDRYNPDVVLLVFSHNDPLDNRSNFQCSCYKPYFVRMGGGRGLQLNGVPVPRVPGFHYREHPLLFRSYFARGLLLLGSKLRLPPQVRVPDPTRGLINRIRVFVESRDADFAVAFARSHRDYERYCRRHRIDYAVLAGERYAVKGRHWTPAGQRQVAAQMSRFLEEHSVEWGLKPKTTGD